MNEKERLDNLLTEAFIKCDDNYGMPKSGQVADYLLSHGVIVPPVKVGDTVYDITRGNMYEYKIYAPNHTTNEHTGNWTLMFHDEDGDRARYSVKQLKKTVFFIREKA